MAFSETACNEALGGITMDRVSLHSGDPGETGANMIASGGRQVATFGAAAGRERQLSADVTFTGMPANQSVTHFGVWANNGGSPVFKCGKAITGDQQANAAGAYILSASTTKVTAAAAA